MSLHETPPGLEGSSNLLPHLVQVSEEEGEEGGEGDEGGEEEGKEERKKESDACISYCLTAPHTAHRTPHTAHRTPRTAHRTPHTAHRTRCLFFSLLLSSSNVQLSVLHVVDEADAPDGVLRMKQIRQRGVVHDDLQGGRGGYRGRDVPAQRGRARRRDEGEG